MQAETAEARAARMLPPVRRLVRRGARQNLSRLLGKVRPEDVSILLDGLTPEQQLYVVDVALADYPDSVGELFVEMDPSLRVSLFERLGPAETGQIFEAMPTDDGVAVVEALPEALRDEVLQLDAVRESLELQKQLSYEDDSAGRLMTRDFFSLRENVSVGEAIQAIRQLGDEVEMVFYLFVLDQEGYLVGVVSLRELLLADPSVELADVMQRSVIHVYTDTDQEEVALIASRYDLLAVPVTDQEDRMVGLVTVDDVITVVNEEVEEDLFKMVGSSDDELMYQERSWRVAGIRLPWILINLVGLTATGFLLEAFQVSLSEALFLMAFVPVVMGMGGNVGSQTSTLAVRGLATGRIAEGRTRSFLLHQLKVGAILGLICGVLVAGGGYWKVGVPAFGLVVGVSLFLSIMFASFNGSLVPIVFRRLGVDPAIAAGPMVTTSSDIAGIVIYFGIAALMIDWLVG